MKRREFLKGVTGGMAAAAIASSDVITHALSNPLSSLDVLDKYESERSLYDYMRCGWHLLEPKRAFVNGWAVGAICEHLEAVSRGEILRLLINVPPGCTKSLTTDVFWPSWEWGPKNRPDRRFISWSYSEKITIRDNRKTRQLVTSPWYRQKWGDRFALVADQNQRVKFENNKTGWKLASSVGGVGVGERADLLIVDDPHNIRQGESEAVRKEVLLWFTEVVPTRVNDPEKSAIVVIMQRVHDDDVSALILAKELGYEHLMLPMEFDPPRRCWTSLKPKDSHESPQRMRYLPKRQRWFEDTWIPKDDAERQTFAAEHAAAEPRLVYNQDPRTEDGELLWPQRFPARVVERDKKVLASEGGSYAVAGQFQQLPVPREGGLFKREWFSKFVKERPPARAKRVRYWDKAGTEGGGARSAGVLMSEWEGSYYIEHVEKGQWSPKARNEVIKSTAHTDGPSVKVWVEQEPGSGGKESAEISVMDLAGFDTRAENVTGDKVTRAGPLAAQCEIRNVILVEGPWNKEFIDEIVEFPNKKFKDQVDAASGAFNKLKLVRTGGGNVDATYG